MRAGMVTSGAAITLYRTGRISLCRHLLQSSSTAISPDYSSTWPSSRKSNDPHWRRATSNWRNRLPGGWLMYRLLLIGELWGGGFIFLGVFPWRLSRGLFVMGYLYFAPSGACSVLPRCRVFFLRNVAGAGGVLYAVFTLFIVALLRCGRG